MFPRGMNSDRDRDAYNARRDVFSKCGLHARDSSTDNARAEMRFNMAKINPNKLFSMVGGVNANGDVRYITYCVPFNAIDIDAAAAAIKTAVHGAVAAAAIDKVDAYNAAYERAYDAYNTAVNAYGYDATPACNARDRKDKAYKRSERAERDRRILNAAFGGNDDNDVLYDVIRDAAPVIASDNLASLLAWLYVPTCKAVAWNANETAFAERVADMFRDENTPDNRANLARILNRRIVSENTALFKNWQFKMSAAFFADMNKFATVTFASIDKTGINSRTTAARRVLREYVLRALDTKFAYHATYTATPHRALTAADALRVEVKKSMATAEKLIDATPAENEDSNN